MQKIALILQKARVFYVCLFIIFTVSCKKQQSTKVVSETPLETVTKYYKSNLNLSLRHLDSLSVTNNFKEAEKQYKLARKYFKICEPILAFVDAENYKALNQPNILKIEEEDATDIKILNPFGFQVLEETLYDENYNQETLINVCKKTKNRLNLVFNNTFLNFKDYHVLWLIRDEIARIALTGITGFDSPVLEQSLKEAIFSYNAIAEILTIYGNRFSSKTLIDNWRLEIEKTIKDLDSDFESFDRYSFIKYHTHKQLELLNDTKKDWQLEFPLKLAFNHNITSLFSNNTFNISYFSSEQFDSLPKERIKLGNQLFREKALSKNNTVSCATCHKKDKYFTDGLPISKGVTRNSPTLLYSALQKSFFYDNRAGSLEGQIVAVVENKNEFHSDLKHMEQVVSKNPEYVNQFKKVYKDSVTENHIRNAIATYIRSLTPFNSKFDNNINGKINSLTDAEKRGFNLFTGKAKCATCHFPPTFNGTVPVLYKESEMELIGVPKNKDTIHAELDSDTGRFMVFNTEEKKHFFKTPTVRNIAKTAPYMHNGVYTTLKEVIDFYNRGGGIGLGIELEHQTLPADKLNLNAKEMDDLIAFMESLTDTI
ncbi:cytochrome-c peroxidase [Aestuariibaculum sediminum]|uniref:Methylamine utilization protein n=1 Tax=Aestuariibaculum sediminum TaxID=2770637 RepID=A0A8J6Q2U2_9FLAO|nr:cytochrome c peroxidase [Aestuariibaculum sediminum]MBD0832646.1 methylamine utilization protein [Aestuariibaculum sediminum]